MTINISIDETLLEENTKMMEVQRDNFLHAPFLVLLENFSAMINFLLGLAIL